MRIGNSIKSSPVKGGGNKQTGDQSLHAALEMIGLVRKASNTAFFLLFSPSFKTETGFIKITLIIVVFPDTKTGDR